MSEERPGVRTADSAELAVLGLVLRDPRLWYAARSLGVQAESFRLPHHRQVWRCMADAEQAGFRLDEAVVVERVAQQPEAEHLVAVVRAARDRPAVADRLADYIGLVEEARRCRVLHDMGRHVSDLALDGEDPDRLADEASRALLQAREGRGSSTLPVQVAQLVEDGLAREGRRLCGEEPEGPRVRLGIPGLDAMVCLRPGHYLLVAGRPSMGKTQLLLDSLVHAGREHPALLCSAEMRMDSLTERMLTSQAFNRGGHGGLESASAALGDLGRSRCGIVDDARSLSAVVSTIRAAAVRDGVRVAGIDYLQRLRLPEPKGASREQVVARASAELANLAGELGILMVVACQLNRAVDTRAEHRPILSDLRESGALEQDADTVLFVNRPRFYKEPNAEDAEIVVAKQRNGGRGIVPCRYAVPAAPGDPWWTDAPRVGGRP